MAVDVLALGNIRYTGDKRLAAANDCHEHADILQESVPFNTFTSCSENGVTTPFLATRGRSPGQRSSKERYAFRRQKLAHSRTRPCSLSSTRVVGFLESTPPVPIATSDFAACCVWLSERGPVDGPPVRRRPRLGGDSSSCRLLARLPSRGLAFRLELLPPLADPVDLLRESCGLGDCDVRLLSLGVGGSVASPSASLVSKISLELSSSSSVSLKIPSMLGRSAASSSSSSSAAE